MRDDDDARNEMYAKIWERAREREKKWSIYNNILLIYNQPDMGDDNISV